MDTNGHLTLSLESGIQEMHGWGILVPCVWSHGAFGPGVISETWPLIFLVPELVTPELLGTETSRISLGFSLHLFLWGLVALGLSDPMQGSLIFQGPSRNCSAFYDLPLEVTQHLSCMSWRGQKDPPIFKGKEHRLYLLIWEVMEKGMINVWKNIWGWKYIVAIFGKISFGTIIFQKFSHNIGCCRSYLFASLSENAWVY